MRRMCAKLRLWGHSGECRRGLRSRDHKRHDYRRRAFLRVRGYCRRGLLIPENAFAFSDKYYAKWMCNEVNICRNGKKVDLTPYPSYPLCCFYRDWAALYIGIQLFRDVPFACIINIKKGFFEPVFKLKTMYLTLISWHI